MIITKEVEVQVAYKMYSYWVSKGYDVPKPTGRHNLPKIVVRVEDLTDSSNQEIECECENCGTRYSIRYQRHKTSATNCYSCRNSLRMKTNNISKFKDVEKVPDDFLEFAHSLNKGELCKKYGKNYVVINRWLKDAGIEKRPYDGTKMFPHDQEMLYVETIRSMSNNGVGVTVADIAKDVGIKQHQIRYLIKSHKIELDDFFSIGERKFGEVMSNFDTFVELNKTKTLKAIAIDHNISVDYLKRAFRETGTDVVIHSYNKSKGELEVKQFINDLAVECYSKKFKKEFEIDCYVPSLNFGVEYCGEYWHSEDKHRHLAKWKACKDRGISLMTIFETEWQNKRSIIESMISARLGLSTRVYARKCQIKEVSSLKAREFHDKNHINGYVQSSVNVALIYNGEVISVLSMVKSRFDKEYEYEISRFSSSLGMTVVGGLSKLFKYFTETYQVESVMTYADLRFGEGNGYAQAGFEFIAQTPPNYFYFKRVGGIELESRHKYQKHKLKGFEAYSSDKTEHQIMLDSGYLRIWDCGSNKYGWKRKRGE